MRTWLAAVIAAIGCAEPPEPPSCIDLGCPYAASGTPLVQGWKNWTPCESTRCYCSLPEENTVCARVLCAGAEPLCASGSHAAYGDYYIPGPPGDLPGTSGTVCFCSPDGH